MITTNTIYANASFDGLKALLEIRAKDFHEGSHQYSLDLRLGSPTEIFSKGEGYIDLELLQTYSQSYGIEFRGAFENDENTEIVHFIVKKGNLELRCTDKSIVTREQVIDNLIAEWRKNYVIS